MKIDWYFLEQFVCNFFKVKNQSVAAELSYELRTDAAFNVYV